MYIYNYTYRYTVACTYSCDNLLMYVHFFLSPCSYLFPNGEDYNPDLQETLSAAPDKHITVSKSCWKIDISFLSLTFGETDRER